MAAQTRVAEMKRKVGGKGKGPSQLTIKKTKGATVLAHRFAFVQDLSEYKEEIEKHDGMMAKAVIITWGTYQLEDKWCGWEKITGRVIGVRLLLRAGRREGTLCAVIL